MATNDVQLDRVPLITVGGCAKGGTRKHTWAVKAGVPMCLRCGLAVQTRQLAASDFARVQTAEVPDA